MTVCLAKIQDIPDIVQLGKELQQEKTLYEDVPLNVEDFAFWLLNCIQSSSTEILCCKTNGKLDGILVLTENTYSWNTAITYGTDLMFLCRKNGIKLINAAKKIAKKRNWHTLIMSTTCNDDRVDKFMNHISNRIGGVYNVSD